MISACWQLLCALPVAFTSRMPMLRYPAQVWCVPGKQSG